MEATPVAQGAELVPDTAITGSVVEPSLEGWDDIYSAPEKLDLEIVGEAHGEEDYSFDMFVVWRKRQRFYYGTDAGCSCPAPFEDCKKISDLTEATIAEIHAALDEWSAGDRDRAADAADLHAKLASI